MDIKQIFGNNIKHYREKKGLTQQQLADIVGLQRAYLSDVECGKRNVTLDIMAQISNGLDIKLQKLLTEK